MEYFAANSQAHFNIRLHVYTISTVRGLATTCDRSCQPGSRPAGLPAFQPYFVELESRAGGRAAGQQGGRSAAAVFSSVISFSLCGMHAIAQTQLLSSHRTERIGELLIKKWRTVSSSALFLTAAARGRFSIQTGKDKGRTQQQQLDRVLQLAEEPCYSAVTKRQIKKAVFSHDNNQLIGCMTLIDRISNCGKQIYFIICLFLNPLCLLPRYIFSPDASLSAATSFCCALGI